MSTSARIAQQNKRWFITGASSGFGRLLAEYLLSLGATVVATARDIKQIEDFVNRYAGHVFIVPLDVTSQSSIDHAVADALAHVGHIDVLVNNAGYGVAGAIEEVSEDEYMPMFQTNVFGLANVTRALLPQFRERRAGTIVNLSSIGGLIGSAGWGYYNATKFAVEGLSEALAAELAPLGVHVMVVEPGPFRTDFLGRSGVEAKSRIPDYELTAGKTREYFNTQAGRQPGDPARAVEAIVDAVSDPNPPRHLLLGRIALTRFRKHLADWNEDLNRWENLTVGADYPESEAATPEPFTQPYGASR
jgi:NAD(P)-dependent dehydrogenase (short-subunit alcohol dehydrogenase family)